jgi:hypothetical protein
VESYVDVSATEHAPVRRAKVYHPMTQGNLSIDIAEWTLDDLGATRTLEEIEADAVARRLACAGCRRHRGGRSRSSSPGAVR